MPTPRQGYKGKSSDGCTQRTRYDEIDWPMRVRDALSGVTQVA